MMSEQDLFGEVRSLVQRQLFVQAFELASIQSSEQVMTYLITSALKAPFLSIQGVELCLKAIGCYGSYEDRLRGFDLMWRSLHHVYRCQEEKQSFLPILQRLHKDHDILNFWFRDVEGTRRDVLEFGDSYNRSHVRITLDIVPKTASTHINVYFEKISKGISHIFTLTKQEGVFKIVPPNNGRTFPELSTALKG